MDAEKTDLNDRDKFTRGESGNMIIGTHTTIHEPMFEPTLVDSISIRGFSQRDQNLMLFHIVVVFKETSRAEEIAIVFLLNAARDSNIPAENYTYQDLLIGDESILMSVKENPDDEFPFGTSLCFRKGRVLVNLMCMGQNNMSYSPVAYVSEERLVELAKKLWRPAFTKSLSARSGVVTSAGSAKVSRRCTAQISPAPIAMVSLLINFT